MAIYVGGTGSANELDDYEEGTWTPTINVGSYNNFTTHKYTKVGRVVHVDGGMTFNNTSSGSTVIISGLPFTAHGGQFTGTVWLRRTTTGNKPYIAVIGQSGNTSISCHHFSNGNDMGGDLVYSNFNHSSTYFQYTVTYMIQG